MSFFKSFKDIFAMQKELARSGKFLVWFRNFEIELDFNFNGCAMFARTCKTCQLSKEEQSIFVESVIASQLRWDGFPLDKEHIDLFIDDVEQRCHERITHAICAASKMSDEQLQEINNLIAKAVKDRRMDDFIYGYER